MISLLALLPVGLVAQSPVYGSIPYVSPTACLALPTVTIPCVAYQGTFTGLGVSGTTGTIVLYSANAPASASLLICPNITVNTTGTGGQVKGIIHAWTSPGGANYVDYGSLFGNGVSLTTGGIYTGCAMVVTKQGSTLSFYVTQQTATGSPIWETEPVVLRIH